MSYEWHAKDNVQERTNEEYKMCQNCNFSDREKHPTSMHVEKCYLWNGLVSYQDVKPTDAFDAVVLNIYEPNMQPLPLSEATFP